MSQAVKKGEKPAPRVKHVSVLPVDRRDVVAESYDKIAKSYDVKTKRPVDLAEDRLIKRWLQPYIHGIGDRVLDVGCGTGLLLDLFPDQLNDPRYLGVDVSPGMVSVARQKHPYHQFMSTDVRNMAERAKDDGVEPFDGLVSLYGALNYVSLNELTDCIESLVKPGGWFFIVLYGFTFSERYPWEMDDIALARPYTEREVCHALRNATSVDVRGLSCLPHRWTRLPWGRASVAADAATLGKLWPTGCTFLVAEGRL